MCRAFWDFAFTGASALLTNALMLATGYFVYVYRSFRGKVSLEGEGY